MIIIIVIKSDLLSISYYRLSFYYYNYNYYCNKKHQKDVNKSRRMFSRSKIKQIRKNFHDMKNPKNLSKSKTEKIEQKLIEPEKKLSKQNNYFNYDDNEDKGIRGCRKFI